MPQLLAIPFENCTLWTDSKDVIFWIKDQSRRYKTQVANRVSENQQKSSLRQWRHVPANLNCASDATPGPHSEVRSKHRWSMHLSSCMSIKVTDLKENA